jgi:hypothetical protein
MMNKFEFMLGTWDLKYHIPESRFSKADHGSGVGTFKRILKGRYVAFDYHATLKHSTTQAHGIFAWDEKSKIYRYWWFEDSGNFLTATCNFVDENTLAMNWHDTLLIQSFEKESLAKMRLRMKYPLSDEQYELILEVVLTKK